MRFKFLKSPLVYVSIILWLMIFYFEFQKGYSDQKTLIESDFVKLANDLVNRHSRVSDLLNYQKQVFLSPSLQKKSDFNFSNLIYSKEFNILYSKKDEENNLGAFTVQGANLDNKTKNYISRAISLTPIFKEAKSLFPSSPWLYFTAENFIYIYPFVDYKKFYFKKDILDLEYFKGSRPENNPRGQLFWTDPYNDEAGTGLMVTASLPIYLENRFVGVISLDVNLHEFSSAITRYEYKSGNLLIVNRTGKVLSSDNLSNIQSKIISSLSEKLKSEETSLNQYRDDKDIYFTYFIKEMGFYLIHKVNKVNFYFNVISGMFFSIMCLFFFVTMNLIYSFYIKFRNRIEADNVNRNKLISLAEMSGGIAHEINNPLAVIKGRAEQLYKNVKRNTADEEYILSSLERIHFSTERIALIVKSLKNFSRDGLNDPLVSTDLNAIIKDTLLLSEIKIRTSDINIEIDEIPNITISCRPYQLAQVLINLINNAYDAIDSLPEKWIKICFELSGKVVRIKIIDSGNGIPKEILSKIFDPFFTSKGHSGTGIGLSISKRIAIDHGGNLYFDTKQANTTFVLELPYSVETK